MNTISSTLQIPLQGIILEAQKHIPVSVVDIAKSLHIKIYKTKDLKDGESGLIRKEGNEYIIYVNSAHPNTRQRFTIAHEIAHFLLDKAKLDQGDEIVENAKREVVLYRSDSADQDKQTEMRADQLAAEILMPAEDFLKIWKESQTLEEVAEKFHVSASAASIRAKYLLGFMAI